MLFNNINFKTRITYLVCLLLMMNFSLSAELSYSQSTRLSLELTGVKLSDVFQSVEEKSEYVFFYSDIVLPELRQPGGFFG